MFFRAVFAEIRAYGNGNNVVEGVAERQRNSGIHFILAITFRNVFSRKREAGSQEKIKGSFAISKRWATEKFPACNDL